MALVLWYEMLNMVNLVSKQLQSKDMLIDVAMEKINGLISFFKEFREIGFSNALQTAKEIALEMNITPIFPQRRVIRRKKQFDENLNDESSNTSQSAQETFRIKYFLYIVDQAILSLTTRFEQYEQYEKIFGFLFNSEKIAFFR